MFKVIIMSNENNITVKPRLDAERDRIERINEERKKKEDLRYIDNWF
jgi:hypothetical protein